MSSLFKSRSDQPRLEVLSTPQSALSKTINANTTLRIPVTAANFDSQSQVASSPWTLPFELKLASGLPGTLEPLQKGSTSVRHYVTARLDFGRLGFGSVTAEQDVRIHRACRSDLDGIDRLVDTQGCIDELVAYTIWSPASVLCSGRARFEIYFQKLAPAATIQSVEIVLKERQVTRVPVTAQYQARPGEHHRLESVFELCERAIGFPQPEQSSSSSSEDFAQPTAAVFDVQLPQEQKYWRRSTTTRVGVEFRHYFAVLITVVDGKAEVHRRGFDAETILSLPSDVGKDEALLPPSYSGDAAPPSYEVHRLDPVYGDREGLEKVRLTEDNVLFMAYRMQERETVTVEKERQP